jgi:hypothetical protein
MIRFLWMQRRTMVARAALVFALGGLWAPGAGADTTTLRLPGTCVSVTTAGTPSPMGPAATWQNPQRAQTEGATTPITNTGAIAVGALSDYLKCTNFGFAVPDGSTIQGITLQIHKSRGPRLVGDGHVYPVRSDNALIGSAGAGSDLRVACPTGWPTTLGTATYGGPTATWGITWGACAPGMTTCGSPTVYNVNHQNFGMALASQTCPTAVGPENANVDWMKVQIHYTPPACANRPWGATTIITPNDGNLANSTRVGATVPYGLQTTVPNFPTCALTGTSQVTITFPAGTDVSGATTGSINGHAFTVSSNAGTTVRFSPPAAALTSTCGSGQPCLAGAATVNINNVRNPATIGTHHLSISATAAVNGDTGSTDSNDYTITDPCIASGAGASAWTPLTVGAADNQPSITDCPRYRRFTITTRVPAQQGCALVANTSEMFVQFNAANVSKVTAAAVKVGTSAAQAVPHTMVTPTIVKLTPAFAIAHNQDLEITLDVVRNPEAPATSDTLTLRATPTTDGQTAATTVTYPIAAAGACLPELDFYVRDWTTNSTPGNFDDGTEPSTGPNWALTSDVWNQYNTTNPTSGDWFPGFQPDSTGSNYAYARISLRTPGAPAAFDRNVTTKFYAAPFGSSNNFGLLTSVPTLLSSTSSPTFVQTTWAPGSLGIPVGNHLCLAVEITSPSDELAVLSLLNTAPDAASKMRVEADNNQAQRNLQLVDTPTPFPPPPPPPPEGGAGGMGGGMKHFAIIHNAGTDMQDMTLRFEAAADVLEQFREPQVSVLGSEPVAYRSGGTLTLPAMQPGEDRWIAFAYGLAPGAEGRILPVGFVQVAGDEVAGGFSFGIRPAPLSVVATQNLRLHAQTFARLASAFGIGEGKAESAATAALVKKGDVWDADYAGFLRAHRRSIAAATASFVKRGPGTDPVGVAAAATALDKAIANRDARTMAIAHLAFLERLDTAQTIRVLAGGNPLDIPQMVRWQRALYSTRPQLQDLSVAPGVVKASDGYLAELGRSKNEGARYAALLSGLMKSFHATADALGEQGSDVRPALDRLQRSLKGTPAALEKAHREFLLALAGASGGTAARQKS